MPDSDVTSRQNRFLHSQGSPLTSEQREKLNREIRTGKVKIRKKVRKGHGLSRGAKRKHRPRNKRKRNV